MPRYKLSTEQDREVIQGVLNALSLERPWSVVVERPKKTRSGQQSRLYWRWLSIIAEETGNDEDELHEYLKRKFVDAVRIQVGDETMDYRTTTNLTTQQMNAYMDKVSRFASTDLGILLPAEGY